MLFQRNSKLMLFMEWLSNMLHLQFLWILGTLLGLVAGGIFPATTGLFSVLRKLIHNNGDIELKNEFWKQYKINFKKANVLGYSLILIAMLLIIYNRLAIQIQNSFASIFLFFSYGVLILFLISIMYIFPSFVHFDLKIGKVIQHAIIIMFLSPIHTVKLGIAVVLFAYSIIKLPVLLPFVSFSIICYFVMKIVDEAIQQVTKKSKVS